MIVYVDMDDTLCDFSGRKQEVIDRDPSVRYPQSIPGFFLGLSPLPGAIDGIRTLMDHPDLDVYILTAPSIKNRNCYTEKADWVRAHLGEEMVGKTIISPHKNLSLGHYLIDDHASGRGQEKFIGTLLHFGSEEFPNWNAIVAYFQELTAAG